VNYFGDPVLWQLNPGIEEDLPEGELSHTARDMAEAWEAIQTALARIQRIIELQAVLIAEFNRTFATYVEGRLAARMAEPVADL